MKFHLNERHEVHECRAKVQDCKFSEASESLNHYSNWEEADAESQRRLQKEFSLIPQVKRTKKHRPVVQKFIPLTKRGANVVVESPRGRSHDRNTSSVTVLTGTPSSDARLLAKIKSGDEVAFTR